MVGILRPRPSPRSPALVRARRASCRGTFVLKLEISYRGMIVIGAALVSLWLLSRLWPVILLVVTAFIFMTALLPYVEWLVRRGLPRGGAVLVILIAVLAILAGLFALVVPAMIDESHSLRDNLPEDARQV